MDWLRLLQANSGAPTIYSQNESSPLVKRYDPTTTICRRNAWSVVASKRVSMWEGVYHVPHGAGIKDGSDDSSWISTDSQTRNQS